MINPTRIFKAKEKIALKLFFIFFCNLCLQPVFSQRPLVFRVYNEGNNLIETNINCIFRSTHNEMWIGTPNGLINFDGVHFTNLAEHIQKDQKLTHDNITSICEDGQGNLWVTTQYGLNKINLKKGTIDNFISSEKPNESFNSNLLHSVIPWENHLVIAQDNRDLLIFSESTNRFNVFDFRKFADNYFKKLYKNINGIYPKNKDEVWLMSNLGLFSYCFSRNSFQYYKKEDLDLFNIKGFCEDKSMNVLWLGSEKLYKFELNGNTFSRIPFDAIKNGNIQCLIKYNEDILLVGTEKGLFEYKISNKSWRTISSTENKAFKIPFCSIKCFFKDENNVIWIGTNRGIFELNKEYQRDEPIYSQANLFSNYGIYFFPKMLKINENQFFVSGVKDATAIKVDYKNGSIQKIFYPSKNNFVQTINVYSIGDSIQLFQTEHNDLIERIRGSDKLKLWKYSDAIKKQLNSQITAIYDDGLGKIYIGTLRENLRIFDKNTKTFSAPLNESNFRESGFLSIQADLKSNSLLLGSTSFGLCRYDPIKDSLLLVFEANEKITDFTILNITQQGTKLFFPSQRKGIGYSDFQFKHLGFISSRDGLISNQIRDLCSIRDKLAILSRKGISIWQSGVPALNFDRHYGLEFGDNYGEVDCLNDSKLFLSSQNSIDIFDISIFKNDAKELKIDRFWINNGLQEIPSNNEKGELKLSFDENYLKWRINFPTFTQTQHCEFQYQLVGFDKEIKTQIGNNYFEYPNLPPGSYRFKVSARDFVGNLSKQSDDFSIEISPPFYETWWFRLLFAAIVLGIIIGYFKLRENQIKQKEKLKTQFNAKVSELEMNALRAQMNPHFVFNCLNSINRLVLFNKTDAATDYLNKFSKLLRKVLDNSRSNFISLKEEINTLDLYLEMEKLRFDHNFSYKINIDPNLEIDEIPMPPMLIQPFVENSIWHGLQHSQKESKIIELDLKDKEGILIITIQDNGIGREASKKIKEQRLNTHKSHGLQVIKERVEILQNLYHLQIDIETIDLQGDDIQGTKVIIRIPLHQLNL